MSRFDDMPATPPAAPAAALPWRRLFYWTVRRELWEHRAVVAAPLVVAGVVLVGFFLSSFGLPHALRDLAAGKSKHPDMLMASHSVAALSVMLTGLIVGVFHASTALHGERRDRSILFWKSLPVSDLITVLGKAAIPLAVIPVVTFAIVFAAQLVVFLWSNLLTLFTGVSFSVLWRHVDLGTMWVVLGYGLIVNALWQAPLFAWFILVSAWAKRVPFLWAMIPFVAPGIIEGIGFRTAHWGHFLGERVFGGFAEAFSKGGKGEAPIHGIGELDPLRTFGLPDIWVGLVFAAIFLAAAVWLRRRREPI